MATFCKTSAGGFNLDKVCNWEMTDGKLNIWFSAPSNKTHFGQDGYELFGEEARHALRILEGVCIFDTTKENA